MIIAAVFSIIAGVFAGGLGVLAAGLGAVSGLTFAYWAALNAKADNTQYTV